MQINCKEHEGVTQAGRILLARAERAGFMLLPPPHRAAAAQTMRRAVPLNDPRAAVPKPCYRLQVLPATSRRARRASSHATRAVCCVALNAPP